MTEAPSAGGSEGGRDHLRLSIQVIDRKEILPRIDFEPPVVAKMLAEFPGNWLQISLAFAKKTSNIPLK